MTLKQMHRFLSRLRMERKNPKDDGGEFVPPQHEISGDGSFDFGDDNGEGNGLNNGSRGGGRRRNRDIGESGDDFNWPSGRKEQFAVGTNVKVRIFKIVIYHDTLEEPIRQ